MLSVFAADEMLARDKDSNKQAVQRMVVDVIKNTSVEANLLVRERVGVPMNAVPGNTQPGKHGG